MRKFLDDMKEDCFYLMRGLQGCGMVIAYLVEKNDIKVRKKLYWATHTACAIIINVPEYATIIS
jgi:hypothetical protein